jgi:hypothetical protein
MAATINPSGNGSANVIRVTGVVGFGFVNVNVKVLVAPTATVDGVNAFVNVGGAATSNDAVEGLPVNPSAVVNSLVVLVFASPGQLWSTCVTFGTVSFGLTL